MRLLALVVTALVLVAGYFATEHHWMWIGLVVTAGLLVLELRLPPRNDDRLAPVSPYAFLEGDQP